MAVMTTRALGATMLIAGALLIAGCSESDPPPTSDPTTTTPQASPTPESPTPTTTEPPSLLTVTPSCVEIDGEFTASAEGLDPSVDYVLGYDPAPTPALEQSVPAQVDDSGAMETFAVVPAGTDPQPGTYSIYLAEAGSDDPIDAVDIQIAESC